MHKEIIVMVYKDLGSWYYNRLPSRQFLVGLGGRTTTLGMKKDPSSI